MNRTLLRILRWEIFGLAVILSALCLGAMTATPIPWALGPAVGAVVAALAGAYVLRTRV